MKLILRFIALKMSILRVDAAIIKRKKVKRNGYPQRAKWGGFASKYIKFGEKVAAKYSDEIIVLSEGVQKYFMDTYGRKTVFIPNGVNRPILRSPQLIKEKYGLEKDEYILFLGRLVPEKGITYLIEAFRKVKTRKKLVIAGGSSDTDTFSQELKTLAQGDGRIVFTGFVQGQMLEELYSKGSAIELRKIPKKRSGSIATGRCGSGIGACKAGEVK